MMNNTKIRRTQKLKEEKTHLSLEKPWLMIPNDGLCLHDRIL